MDTVTLFAERLAEGLFYGATTRTICPACRGGEGGEKSFVVGREPGRFWWKCFRAKCGTHGHSGGHALPQTEYAAKFDRLMPYERPMLPLEQKDVDYFMARFGVNPRWSVRVSEDDEYLVPVRARDASIRGIVVRQPVWKGVPRPPRQGRADQPKTKLYMASLDPTVAWYVGTDSVTELVLVEDQISAMKVAQYTRRTAVALLGNSLNEAAVRDIFAAKPELVTVALDPGAEKQAARIARDWGMYFKRTRVLALPADPKDLPSTELVEAFR